MCSTQLLYEAITCSWLVYFFLILLGLTCFLELYRKSDKLEVITKNGMNKR